MSKALVYVLLGSLIIGSAEWYLRSRGYSPMEPASAMREHTFADIEMGWSSANIGKFATFPTLEEDFGRKTYAHLWPDGAGASFPLMRRPSKYRVMVIGCSHTYGEGVDDHNTFPWKLNEKYRDITFYNYGTSGFSTYQSYLLEKRLFENHPQHTYDLVIYAAIKHHILRNVGNVCHWNEDPTPKSHKNIDPANNPNLLKSDCTHWCYPIAYLKADHSLGTIPAWRQWPGDNYLALINIAKRLFIFYTDRYTVHKGYTPEALEVFQLILDKMNDCAQQHGAKFATVCLEDKGATQLSDIHPQNFPYIFVTYGREGQPNGPQFYVSGDISNHGNAIVQTNWAKHISIWLDSYWPGIK